MAISTAPERDADDRLVSDQTGTASQAAHDVPGTRTLASVEAPGARVTVRRPRPGTTRLDVVGEIDMATVGALSQCLLAAVELPACREVLVDLTGVEFLGAAGVAAFAQAHARAVERAVIVRLVSVSRTAYRTLEVIATEGCFDTWPAGGEEGANEEVLGVGGQAGDAERGRAHDAPSYRAQRTAATHTGHAAALARIAAEVQQRKLRGHRVIAQAVGVLAGRTGASPTQARAALGRYAERHRFVVSELAADVVAGRMTPHAIVAPVDKGEPDDTTQVRTT